MAVQYIVSEGMVLSIDSDVTSVPVHPEPDVLCAS